MIESKKTTPEYEEIHPNEIMKMRAAQWFCLPMDTKAWFKKHGSLSILRLGLRNMHFIWNAKAWRWKYISPQRILRLAWPGIYPESLTWPR